MDTEAAPPTKQQIKKAKTLATKIFNREFGLKSYRLSVQKVFEGNLSDPAAPMTRIEWAKFIDLCHEQWRWNTCLCNTVIAQAMRMDCLPVVAMRQGSLPEFKWSETEATQFVRTYFPEIESQAAGSLSRRAYTHYLKVRRDYLLTGKKLPVYSFPVSTVHNTKDLELFIRDGRLHLALKLGYSQDTVRWVTLQFSQSRKKNFRDLAKLEDAVAKGYRRSLVNSGDKYKLGTVTLSRSPANESDYRTLWSERDPVSRARRFFALTARFALHAPRDLMVLGTQPVIVHTDPQYLFRIRFSPTDRPWSLKAENYHDQLCKRWTKEQVNGVISRYDRYLRDAVADYKLSRRLTRSGFREFVSSFSCKHQRKIVSLLHKLTRLIVDEVHGYALRKGVSAVYYNDQLRSFLPHFPWSAVFSLLEHKLHEIGVPCYRVEFPDRQAPDWENVVKYVVKNEKAERRKEQKQAKETATLSVLAMSV